MSVIDTLICDRTQADVNRVFELKRKILTSGLTSLSAEEKDEYMLGLKGAYNYRDLNRVGEAVSYLATWLQTRGYAVDVTPKSDWGVTDIPTQLQAESYLQNIKHLRSILAVKEGTPAAPESMDNMTISQANDIEQILKDLDELLTKMVAAYRHCGAVSCGGTRGLMR